MKCGSRHNLKARSRKLFHLNVEWWSRGAFKVNGFKPKQSSVMVSEAKNWTWKSSKRPKSVFPQCWSRTARLLFAYQTKPAWVLPVVMVLTWKSSINTSKLLKLQQKFCRQHQVQLPNLSNRFKFHTLTLFYKIRNGLAPTYLSEILPETLALSSGRNLRRHVYPFPRINKSSTMQSFLPRATVFWNELPASIQSSSSLHSFKAKLRDLLKI